MAKKFFRTSNVILIIVMICCLGGCYWLAQKDRKNFAETQNQIESLPVLTTTEQILNAINAQDTKTYLITNYRFPHYTTVTDPSPGLYLEGEYLYIKSQKYSPRKRARVGSTPMDKDGAPYIVYGRLFFDSETELTGFSDAEIGSPEYYNKEELFGTEYRYEYLDSKTPLTFAAKLGNHSAVIAEFNNKRVVTSGDTETLTHQNSEDRAGYAAFLGIVFLFSLIIVWKSRHD